jgi:hypothetical protein
MENIIQRVSFENTLAEPVSVLPAFFEPQLVLCPGNNLQKIIAGHIGGIPSLPLSRE